MPQRAAALHWRVANRAPARVPVLLTLVRGGFSATWYCDAVLFLPVADGGLDGVFASGPSSDLTGGSASSRTMSVFLMDSASSTVLLHPFRRQGRAGDGRAAAKGFKFSFLDDVGVRI